MSDGGAPAHPVIAIDGGAGTGKTTTAARVARELGFSYVDSGAIYRSVALALAQEGIDANDPDRLDEAVRSLDVRVEPAPDRFRVFIGGTEVSDRIRAPEISALSSRVAVRRSVRARVRELLRGARALGPLVVEGRDIGTVVFPDAPLKVFLTAELEVRAERRRQQLERTGVAHELERVAADIAERDARDSSRHESPLVPAPDAVRIDTSGTSLDEQVDRIVALWRDREGVFEPPRSDPADRRRRRYRLGQWLIRRLFGILLGLRYEGTENVPLRGGVLLAANHKSYLDPPIVGAGLRRELRYFAKRELFSVPLLGRLIRDYGAFPIDRGAFDRRAVARALSVLRDGEALLVFPEGTRIRRDSFGEPREGIALLALEAGVPIVPVHVASTWEPRRSLFRRIPIVVRYGAPLRYPALSRGAERRSRYATVAREVLEAIDRTGQLSD